MASPIKDDEQEMSKGEKRVKIMEVPKNQEYQNVVEHGGKASSANPPNANVSASASASASASNSSNTQLVMIHPITSSTTICLMGEVLKAMDICTCATAEKYTGVQCVTAAMSDVVFEHVPSEGQVLELTGRVVLVGSTSLEVALTVVSDFSEGGGIGGEKDEMGCSSGHHQMERRSVCEAFFTYVTTRHPVTGEKRFCPPLPDDQSFNPQNQGATNNLNRRTNSIHDDTIDNVQWERTMASFRKNFVRIEKKLAIQLGESQHTLNMEDLQNEDHHLIDDRTFEMTEVVMPPHQNHMKHTFGGVVMMWMARAALVAASRGSQRPVDDLSIQSIQHISFHVGSDVSDHLIFRPSIRAVFDEGESAEVEVKVYKRAISSGEEISLNTGYFYVTAKQHMSHCRTRTSRKITKKKLYKKAFLWTTNLTPSFGFSNQKLSDHTYHTLRPFARYIEAGMTNSRASILRRQALETRRILISHHSGTHALTWNKMLAKEASILTLFSILRLINNTNPHAKWFNVKIPPNPQTPLIKQHGLPSDAIVEWTTGLPWGHNDTLIVRASATLNTTASVQQVTHAIIHRRDEWDSRFSSYSTLEEGVDNNEKEKQDDNNQQHISWDVVHHNVSVPFKLQSLYRLATCRCASNTPKLIQFTLLRAWKTDWETNTAFYASQSVQYKETNSATKHDYIKPKKILKQSRIMPSGFIVDKPHPNSGGVRVRYIAQHNMNTLRDIVGSSRARTIIGDKAIISTVTQAPWYWLKHLNSLDYDKGL